MIARKRSAVLIVFGLAIVSVVIFSQLRGVHEPVFEGRKLTSWLERHVPSSSADPPYNSPGWHKAEAALRQIGTNAIPTLLKMIEAKDPPPWMLNMMQWGERHRVIRRRYRWANERNEEAEYAFSVLKTNGAQAVPELIRIYQRNASPSSQRCAALALGHFGHAAEAAVPVLIRNFGHTDRQVRFYAVSAVMSIGGKAELVVPALTGALKDSSVDVRWNAMEGLERYGRPVVSNLLAMLDDTGMVGSTSITQELQRVLWRMAP